MASQRSLRVSDAVTLTGLKDDTLYGRIGEVLRDDNATGRLLRDAKLYEIGAGTSEIRRMLIGRELFEKTG